ncbi:MAG TPA: hypothetical protein VG452_08405 [Egibacteraceae bacterium]|nr:hypothetical protein [Egibacteraceae bacterium]
MMWQVVWIFVFTAVVAWLEVTSRPAAGGLPSDAALWAELEALEQRDAGWHPTVRRSRRLPPVLTLTAAAATVVVALSDFFAGQAGGSEQTPTRA